MAVYRYKNGRFAPKPKPESIWTTPATVYWTPLDGVARAYRNMSPAQRVAHDAEIKSQLEATRSERERKLREALKPFQRNKKTF